MTVDVSKASDVVKNFVGETGMPVGIDTAIKALRPGCTFEIAVAGGGVTYHKWYHPDGLKPPTKVEIDEEMVYQEKLAKHSRCINQMEVSFYSLLKYVQLRQS